VLDLDAVERLELEVPGDGPVTSFHFDAAGRLLGTRGGVLSRWEPETRTTEVLVSDGIPFAFPIGDGRRLYIGWEGTGARSVLDLENGSRTVLPQAHQPPGYFAFDPTGSIVVTGHRDGEVRVGPLFSEEPHLLLGHEPGSIDVWVSPDGEWIASLGSDDSLNLWPMPDLSEPPLHTLPHVELMAKLKTLTNLRAVPDEEPPTGYTIEPDFTAYRGWERVPTW
jgi:WD40 repeat protein